MKAWGHRAVFTWAFHLGMIVRPHRFFLLKDLVFFRISNGMAERMPVTAVSSKGYRITEYMMQYDFVGPTDN